jgi:hypothetical protein
MKNTLLLTFLLACFSSAAQQQQQPLFTMLAYNGDVSLGGHPVNAGQVVYDDGRDLLIEGKGSYANILTETGYALKLKRGRYLPTTLNSEAAAATRRPSGSLIESPPIVFLTAPEPAYAEIFGDSVFLFWKGSRSGKLVPPFTVSLLNMFTDPLLDTTSEDSFCAVPVGQLLLQENAILVRVRSSQAKSQVSPYISVRRMLVDVRLRIQNDLQMLVAHNETEYTIVRMAVFESNDLFYDVTYCLYKLMMAEKAAGVPIVSNYYRRLLKKYGMDTL